LCATDFIVSDFEKEFPEGQWDTIVAFEIIEHLENPDFFLENVKKALTPEGVLVFSLPHDADVPGHKHVYDEAKARALIESHFKIKEWHIQDKSVIAGVPTLRVPTPLTYVGVAE
jgi:2-polyprenyl-3-methyl-5-hydroxy-6-metoxy-1,4-benzoquinol methylase